MKLSRSLPFQFEAHETVREGVQRLTRRLVEEATAQGRRSREEQVVAVHAVRLVIKRFRALLRLLRPGLGDAVLKEQNARLREAAQRLAAAREATVLGKTLGDLAGRLSGEEAASVRGARKALPASGPGQETGPGTVNRDLQAAVHAVSHAATELEKAQWPKEGWSVLEVGLRASYRRARRRFHKAQACGSAKAFHAWRTATKSLQYQLRLLSPAGGKHLARLSRELDRIQECLGDDHDLSELLKRSEGDPGFLGTATMARRVKSRIRARQVGLRRVVLKAGATVFEEKTKPFVACRHREWKAWREATAKKRAKVKGKRRAKAKARAKGKRGAARP